MRPENSARKMMSRKRAKNDDVFVTDPAVQEDPLQIGVLTLGRQKTVCLGLSNEMLAEVGRGKVPVVRGQDINLGHPVDILLIGGKSPRSVHSKLRRFGVGVMKSPKASKLKIV